eukprot:TRINITY_DN14299_c0_g1_i1.p1 TRINITY_DN14299_c0_g1~~TRINITY_DN14299_c0_g1_i1.p1  ORF type:complete len:508 (+),score=78.19 TRINITY_DN14299_c0_g1_i1:48-1526(+)
MPILWGIMSFPTLIEISVGAMMGKIGSGTLFRLPGSRYLSDRLIVGLEFLRIPKKEEVKGVKEVKKGSVAVCCDRIPRGMTLQLPCAGDFAMLCNLVAVVIVMSAVRILWDAIAFGSPPANHVLAPTFSPSDFAAICLVGVALFSLLILQKAYGNTDASGALGTYSAIFAAITAFGVVITEEVEIVNFSLLENWDKLSAVQTSMEERGQNAFWSGILLTATVYQSFAALVCVIATYGLCSPTWRWVCCHYQMSDRFENRLSEAEAKRRDTFLNYKMEQVRAGGAGISKGENFPFLVGYSSQYWAKATIWMSNAAMFAPFVLTATFFPPLSKREDIDLYRQLLLLLTVVTRFTLFRPFMQTFLYRDTNEMTKNLKPKQFEEVFGRIHSQAVILLCRTGIILLGPVAIQMGLLFLYNRVEHNNGLTQLLFKDRMSGLFPDRLTEFEYKEPQDVYPAEFWKQLILVVVFWVSCSEAALVLAYCCYRWASRLFKFV